MRRLLLSPTSQLLLSLLTSSIAVATVAPLTMAAADWKVPRTPWGEPDLQGTWSTAGELSVPFERQATYGDRQFLTDEEFEQRLKQADRTFAGQGTDPPSHWIERSVASRRTSFVIDPPNGRLPAMTAEGKQRLANTPRPFRDGPFNGPEEMSLWERCITRGGMPGEIFPTVYNATTRIVQGPGYVAFTYEMIHDTRVIPTDGRPRLGGAVRQYFGDSRGRWDGDTLVVEVTNFGSKAPYRGSSEGLRLVERFSRLEGNVVRYRVTVDDPRTWERQWTAELDMREQQTDLFEYACHEGNHAMFNMLTISRAADQK